MAGQGDDGPPSALDGDVASGVVVLNSAGEVTALDEGARQALGQTAPEQLLGQSLVDLSPELGALVARVMAGGRARADVTLRAGGHVNVSASRAVGPGGVLLTVTAAAPDGDVDPLDDGADLFAVLSLDGTIQVPGRRVHRTLGFPRRGMKGTNLLGLLDPADASRVATVLGEMAQTHGRELTVEFRLRHADGTYRQLSGSMRRGLDGPHVTGVILQATDVTERQAVALRLQREQAVSRLAFDLSPTPQMLLTSQGLVTTANRALLEVLGLPGVDVEGHPVSNLFTSEDGTALGNAVASLRGELTRHDVEVRLKLGNNKTPLNVQLRLGRAVDPAADGTILCQVVDLSERRRNEREIQWHTQHDALTGLWNRRAFETRLEATLKGKPEDPTSCALMLDLDGLKIINDTCSTAAGDELLRQAASLLLDGVRTVDLVARLGGDEFGVLLSDTSEADAQMLATRLTEMFSAFRFGAEGKIFSVTVSTGLVALLPGVDNMSRVLGKLDVTLQMAKERGRNRVVVFRNEDAQLRRRHQEMDWVSIINAAIEENRFVLFHQAIVPAGLGITHMPHSEILVRMVDRDGKLVPPDNFIPAAERYNLMPAVDSWLISTLFAALQAKAPALQGREFSINLSGTSVNDENFLDGLLQQFDLFSVDPAMICFELTEAVAVANLNRVSDFIQKMRALGCRFSLDDFGAGFSSFPYLKKLSVDFLKIDGSFIKQMLKDPMDQATVSAINQVGHAAGMRTIAEWVEDDAIRTRLADMGVDYVQGWGIHKPEPLLRPQAGKDRPTPL